MGCFFKIRRVNKTRKPSNNRRLTIKNGLKPSSAILMKKRKGPSRKKVKKVKEHALFSFDLPIYDNFNFIRGMCCKNFFGFCIRNFMADDAWYDTWPLF